MDDQAEDGKETKIPSVPKKRRKKRKGEKPKYSPNDVEWNEMIMPGWFYSRENLMRRLGLTESCYSAMLNRGMPQIGDGKRVYFEADDVIQWMKSLGRDSPC